MRFIAGDGRVIPRLAQELGPANPNVRAQVQEDFAIWTDQLRSMLERAGCAEPETHQRPFETEFFQEFDVGMQRSSGGSVQASPLSERAPGT